MNALRRRFAELLDPESAVRLEGEWSFLARLSIPAELPVGVEERDARNAARLALTAGRRGARGDGDAQAGGCAGAGLA